MKTSYFFSWSNTSVISLNFLLMNKNQYASMETINPSTLSLSSFFEINPFLMNDHLSSPVIALSYFSFVLKIFTSVKISISRGT